VDILFEKNGLVYIRNSNLKTDKEKEKATSDNYKIINHKYISILNDNEKELKDVVIEIKKQVDFYFEKTYNEEREKTYLGKDTKTEIEDAFAQINTTGGFVVIQITKDVISDASQLLLSAECKQRSKRIKSKYYKLLGYFKGGTKRKRTKTKKRIKSTRYYRT